MRALVDTENAQNEALEADRDHYRSCVVRKAFGTFALVRP